MASIMPTLRPPLHPLDRQPTLEASSNARDGSGPCSRNWRMMPRRSASLAFTHAHDRGGMCPGFKQASFFPEQRVEVFSLVRSNPAEDNELVARRHHTGGVELQAA